MVKKIAEKFNRLSRVHQRHRQQTDGIVIAISERNVVTFAKNGVNFVESGVKVNEWMVLLGYHSIK